MILKSPRRARLLVLGASALLAQAAVLVPGVAEAASNPSPGPMSPIVAARPHPSGHAHLGGGGLPTAGGQPPEIRPAPSQPAPGTPSGKPVVGNLPTTQLPAHGVLLPASGTGRQQASAPASTAPANPPQHPLGIPAPSSLQSSLTPFNPLAIGGAVQADNSLGCGNGANEPNVAQSKANPSLVVVAAQEYQNASGCADSHAWAFASHDAGLHFSPVLLPGLQDPASGDVAVTFDPAHQVFVFSFLEFTRNAAGNPIPPGRVGVETSADGLTWGLDTTLASFSATDGLDKDMITVDQNPSSPHFGRVAVTWTDIGTAGANFVEAYTDDGGHTWHPAIDDINFPSNQCGNGTSPAFNANGELMVAWLSCDNKLKEELSSDGGNSFTQPADTVIASVNGVTCTPFRCNSFPSLAGDPNPNDKGGTAFVVVWDDQGQGCSGSSCFSLAQGKGLISLNDGSTWGGPTGFSFFHVDFADLGDKYFPWAAFSPSGRLNIGYINRSVSASLSNPHGTSYHAWVTEASSLAALVNDSYITFQASSTPSNPGSRTFIGDYTNISSQDNNFDTLYAYPDQRGTSNNHVSMLDLCYMSCFTPLTPFAPRTNSASSFTDLYEFNTDSRFGSGFDFWNAVGIREGANGTTVDDDTNLYGDRYFSQLKASSAFGPPLNDYTVENDNVGHGPTGAWFPQVHSFGNSGGAYTVEWASGSIVLSVGAGRGDSLTSGHVLKVYDVLLGTGNTYRLGLRPAAGNTSNYSLALHSASRGNEQGRPNAAADSSDVAPGQPAFISYTTGSDPSQFDGVVVVNNNGGSGSYTLYVDFTVPTGSININGGASTTSSSTVTLNLAASNPLAGDPVMDMRFSNDGSTFGSWVHFASSTSYTLPAGNGAHTVFVQYRNGAGGVSATLSHTITKV